MKRTFVVFLVILTAIISIAAALREEITSGSIGAIVFVISALVGLLGPKPLEILITWLKLEGQWAVLFVYGVSFVVGILGLLISNQLFQYEFVWDNALAIAGLLFAGASFAFEKLKDEGKL